MINEPDKSKKIAEHLVSVMLKKELKYKEDFEEWINDSPTAFDILNELTDEKRLNEELQTYGVIDKQKSAQTMLQKISAHRHKVIFRRTLLTAAALIAISFIVWNYFPSSEKMTNQSEIAIVEPENVRLIINDSEELKLNEDTIISSTMQLHKTGKNEIAYKKIENKEVTKNRLIVPRKERFSIRLSDGTKVMLNANSELIFPSEFTGNKREVTIKGEAFFEVVKDNEHPFIVHCDTIAIEVYGTVFNVNNRTSFSTFLCEGSIGVSINNKRPQMLLPNQLMTIVNRESKIETIENGEKYIDWTTGYFIFEGDTIKEVMEKLSQWYETELIVLENGNHALITGSFERSLNLDDIITSIEVVSGVKLLKK